MIKKKDQYIPHEVSMRSTTEVMNLIEQEGMAGYGIYWTLRPLTGQMKIRQPKLEKILKGYGLLIA